MGFVVEFDAKNNILRGALEGPVTDSLLLSSYEAAARYATSLPPCRGLWDFSQVTSFDLSSDAVRVMATRSPIIASGYIRVVVAPQDLIFGMMRMLEILSEKTRPELHVVRTIAEAYSLLDVKSPEFSALS